MEKLELYYENKACDVFYNVHLHAVQTKWKGVFVFGDEFRNIMNKITDLLIEKKTHIIIADARNMKIIDPDDQAWILYNWYPRTTKAGFNFEALIVTKDSFNERSINQIVEYYDERKIQTVYFYSYEEAAKWIANTIGTTA